MTQLELVPRNINDPIDVRDQVTRIPGIDAPCHCGRYTYTWGNNPRRAELKGRPCVVDARGRMRSVLVRFLDTAERVVTSERALRQSCGWPWCKPAEEAASPP